MLLSVAAAQNDEVEAEDVDNAYLCAEIDPDIYMQQRTDYRKEKTQALSANF